ncbi:MAG: N-6 DNA methylase [Haliangiales bacterium]
MHSAQRLDLGQWYTPPDVADLALSLALPTDPAAVAADLRVLDPACGDGVFLARAQARGIGTRNGALCGIEVDPIAAAAASARVPGAHIIAADLFGQAAEHAIGGYLSASAASADAASAGRPLGFDAVVGNPPYVRQERRSGSEKRLIRAALGRDFPGLPASLLDRLTSRGDLAAACIVRALRFARPGARVALVVSSALLDAGYASVLWQLVAKLGRVCALIDAPRERWFKDAAINAIILVIERADAAVPAPAGETSTPTAAPAVSVARLTLPTPRAATQLRDGARLDRVGEIRHAPADETARWAAYVRAPSAWFAFEASAGPSLVPLSALATVRRGVTSGANDIFYLSRQRAAELAIEPELLAPLLRSPREHATIAIAPQHSSHVMLTCPPRALGDYPAAQRYIESHRDATTRRTLRARKPWWSLVARPARLFLTKAYGARFVQHLADAPMVADQRVYRLELTAGAQGASAADDALRRDEDLLAAILNSTFSALAIESLGRASMGEGALEWTVADAACLPVLDPRQLDPDQADQIRVAFAPLSRRPIGDVFSERDAADRRQLDHAVAAHLPRPSQLLDACWEALVESVARRHARVGNRRDRPG